MTKNLVRTTFKGIVYEIAVYVETEGPYSSVHDDVDLQQGILEELAKAMLIILHPGLYQHEDDIAQQAKEGAEQILRLREAQAKAGETGAYGKDDNP